MKMFLAILFFLNISCENKERYTVIGVWELSESKTDNGAKFVKNDDFEYLISFSKDSMYTQSLNGKIFSGIYKISHKNILELIDPVINDTVLYSYRFEKERLILDEIDLKGSFICDEGCSKIFEKIKK
ncbi:hypothetical protein [Chryseobacterium indoltheticum]|uniref:Lipocalin-like domain-containing protein n=3 Tax=Chryseobacterium TaxID=59732 RepID=A0A381FNJ9_9FLAO|nr:hypothetical protein [Chryseobacterium indoltheticum]SUX48139.1 Uncharacterised protein [Chryseobacterium indoltheticum]